MIYAITVLAISWVIVYLSEKKNLLTIWFTPLSQRTKEFVSGFLILAILSAITQLLFGYLSGVSWQLSDSITPELIFNSTFYDLKSVLFEELTFRGIILYLLLRYTGKRQTSLLLTAAAFGVYHWFTFGVMGNIMAMIVVFIITGYMGYVFAVSYEKTNSIILPIALHLGWNVINNTMFSNGPNGIQLLEAVQGQMPFDPGAYSGLISLGWYLLIPSVVLFILHKCYTPQTKDFKLL
ncbi:MAG: CPBP family intramembrane metalloprotease [Gracilimonas sp.]|uniref:CPBP family intramembrane glutamic endopeptidase n=1 Tax=Gracilimonas TaxID=649462 RepID=UPI001B23FCE2|nr:CPBP family intramembrane glutamic endopeptidase [Gracilimonas sp.]MBO6587030.1 CPBP family intramembrane metalloprotease [Gracilimonas sp.]MBO6614482.1 CPBP family intramembrane metalloprotease [Gracilimonas sp.]